MSWIKQEPDEVDPLLVDEVDTVPTTQFTTCIPKDVSVSHGIFVSSPNLALPPISKNEVYKPPHPLKKKRENFDRQSRTIIANVHSYMDMEKAAKNFLIEPSKSQSRTMMACGVSKRTVMRISLESKQIQNNLQDGFPSTERKRSQVAPFTSIDSNDAEACRTLIFKSILESDHPLDCGKLHEKLLDANLFTGCRSSFRRLLEKLGIQVKRTRNFSKAGQTKGTRSIVMEKHESQYKKFVYLRDLKKYQAEGRPVIFTALTTLARAHCKADKGQQRKDTKVLKVTRGMFADEPEELSREQWRAVLLSAGDKSGFVTSGFLIWRCIKKLGSNMYDENANYKKYVTWVKNNLIPNIPEGAAVVLDHETIYDRNEDPVPTHTSDKEEMKAWLERNGIHFEPDAAKVELFELIRQNKRNHSKFEIDSILEKTGHPVLRTPPNFTELNPMMVMLKEVKTWMKGQSPNVNPRFVDIAKLTVSKMLTTSTDAWTSTVVKCQATADKYFAFQAPMEKKISEQIVANHGCIDLESEENDDSDSNEEREDSHSDESEPEEEATQSRTSETNPDLWMTSMPNVFVAGDDFESTSAPKRTSAKKTPKVKRRKTTGRRDSEESDEWVLDGKVTI